MSSSPARSLDEADASTRAVVDTLRAHRRALVEGRVDGVIALTLEGPRPPWERDLLVDMATIDGMETAVKRLRGFWCKAATNIVGVRPLPDGDVEIFEELVMPDGRELSTVTLLRPVGTQYRVVATTEAPDDTTRLLALCETETPPLDDAAVTRSYAERYGPTAELVVDEGDGDGVLGHPSEEWLARVRGPLPWAPIRERLTRRTLRLPEAVSTLEVSMTPCLDRGVRARQHLWLGRAAAEIARHAGAPWIYVQRAEKVLGTELLARTLEPESAAGRELASVFVRLVERQGWSATRGMSHLMLPEIEVELDDWAEPSIARRVVGAVSVGVIEGRVPSLPSGRQILSFSGVRCTLALGRRGAEPGQTYGRYGALVVRPADREDEKARSGPRIRLDL